MSVDVVVGDPTIVILEKFGGVLNSEQDLLVGDVAPADLDPVGADEGIF